MNRQLFFFVFALFTIETHAQELVKIVHYNLLNYGNTTSYCTTSNNGIASKDGYLKTIIKHANPDVLTVNEMGSNAIYATRILQNVLNTDGVSTYEAAVYSNNSSSSLVNMLFYNSEKIVLNRQFSIKKDLNGNNLVRVIDHYELYYNDASLFDGADTVFLNVFVAHLKAGNTSADAAERALATDALMYYISSKNIVENVIVSGDFNVYRSSEAGFQNLIDYSLSAYNFQDPVNAIGSWNSNSSYAAVHTQSTQTSGSSCHSGGGLDDRFDFILMNKHLIQGDFGAQYVSDTYKAIGNDGNHYNTSITNGSNTSVPSNVLNALYNMSDHLPVEAQIEVAQLPNSITQAQSTYVGLVNPIQNEQIQLVSNSSELFTIQLHTVSGQFLEAIQVYSGGPKTFSSKLNPGIYIARIFNQNNQLIATHKLVKN